MYDKSLPDSFDLPSLRAVLLEEQCNETYWIYEITTIGGQVFTSFAKSAALGKGKVNKNKLINV